MDANDIIPLIKTSADMRVRSILGTYFYKDLLTKFNAQTLNSNEVTLVEDYIKPAVAWRASSEAIIELSYQLKNKGIQTQSGDYSTSPEQSAVMFNYHHKADKAAFYENRLEQYLIDNKALFPVFTSQSNTDSVAKGKCSSANLFNTNIHFI